MENNLSMHATLCLNIKTTVLEFTLNNTEDFNFQRRKLLLTFEPSHSSLSQLHPNMFNSVCMLICLHAHLFLTHLLSRAPLEQAPNCVCFLTDACRCMKLCRATVTAASMSGGLNPGPFVLLTLWTTCQPAGREYRAARSGQ